MKVAEMFDAISGQYDRINRILSLGMDRSWRKTVASHLPPKARLKVLDLATGTGDQAQAIFASNASVHSVIGLDVAEEMLHIAKTKVPEGKFMKASAEDIPFAENHFDVATFSFGIRNVASPAKALREMHRILKPKGRALVLEFSMPPQPIKMFYLFYLRYILAPLGGMLSKNKYAYRYLNRTIEAFPSGQEFCKMLKTAGFSRVRAIPLALGGVTLYLGDK